MANVVGSNRIEWIDSLRGLIMLFVVLFHVENYSLVGGNIQGMDSFFAMFRMPLFLFVSGFLAFKANQQPDFGTVRRVLAKKLRVLILPTLFFGLLYTLTVFASRHGFSARTAIGCFFESDHKLGYWFTWVLFPMFVVYYLVSYLMRNRQLYVRQITLACVALVCYLLSLLGTHFYQKYGIANFLSLYNFLQYFQFFIFGTIFSCYRERMFQWLDKKYSTTAVLVLFVVCYIVRNEVMGMSAPFFKLMSKGLLEVGRFMGVMTFVALFRCYSDFFSSKTAIGRFLQYTGRHTLDVYMLHFFFLPRLVMVGVFFKHTPNFMLELSLCVGLSLLIMLCCFAVSCFIRVSPVLSYLFLGEKKK